MNKIFGIGLNKTATRSLARALRILGFRTLHKGDDATSELVLRAQREEVPLLTHIGEQFDAYLDVAAILETFPTLDAQYPDSRFILTTRDLDAWLDSRERHVRANQRRAAIGEYEGSWLTVDHEAWIREREAHHDRVMDYFEDGRDRLLRLDIIAGDGWPQLATFLGRPIPRQPFPWENRQGTGTYSGVPRLNSLPRRVSALTRRVYFSIREGWVDDGRDRSITKGE